MSALASTCLVRCGSVGGNDAVNVSLQEPACGWDTASATVFFSDLDGDINVQLTAAGFDICDGWFTDMDPLAQMYIHGRSKQRVEGGWDVTFEIRGLNQVVDVNGIAKFYREPYQAEMQFRTTGGENIMFLVGNAEGGLQATVTNSCVRFNDPGVTFTDCYIASQQAFDPHLVAADLAGNATLDPTGGAGPYTERNLMATGSGTNWTDLADMYAGILDPSTDYWTNGLTTGDHEELPAAIQSGGEQWPLTRVTAKFAAANLLCYNFNNGYVLTQREADRVCPGVDLWFMRDSYSYYSDVEFT